MQTVTGTTQSVVTDSILAGAFISQAAKHEHKSLAEVALPAFHYSFAAPLVETVTEIESKQTRIKIAVDETVLMIISLRKGETDTDASDVRIYFEPKAISARAEFVAATLQALFLLGGSINLSVPALQLEMPLKFDAGLEEAGPILRKRQIAYRAMVIESAFQQPLGWPLLLTNTEADQVSFVYHALTEHPFVWHYHQGEYAYRADENALKLLDEPDRPSNPRLYDNNYSVEILGEKLPLGRAIITVENAVLVNVDDVRRELAILDGHEFRLIIQSLAGLATFDFPEAPQASTNLWDKRIKELVALEQPLDEKYFQAVNDLAASTLSGLTAEEKASITEPFTLGEETFADPADETYGNGSTIP